MRPKIMLDYDSGLGGGTEDKGPKVQRAGTPGKGREGVNPSPRVWGLGICSRTLHALRHKASADFGNPLYVQVCRCTNVRMYVTCHRRWG